ncbi:MAG: 5'-3' exonuclease [Brevibacterium aurantiacum]
MTQVNESLLLIDGHSLAYRAFHALPVENFSTSTGQSTNAIYGFISMLINVLRDESPSHVAVAFDLGRQTFRLEEYPEYKAGRAKTPPEFHPQIDLIKDIVVAMGITVVTKEGFEADDALATMARMGTEAGAQVEVMRGQGLLPALQRLRDDPLPQTRSQRPQSHDPGRDRREIRGHARELPWARGPGGGEGRQSSRRPRGR